MAQHISGRVSALISVALTVVFGLATIALAQVVIDLPGAKPAEPSPASTRQVENRVEPPTLHPRSNYAWPFSHGPYYGDVAPSRRNDPDVLVTTVGSFELVAGDLPFPDELTTPNRLEELVTQHFVILTRPDPQSVEQIRSTVESLGGEIVDWLPGVARLNAAAHEALQRSPGLIALEPYHPAFKLHPSIGREPLPNPDKALSEVYTLDVALWPGEDAHAVADKIHEFGGHVLHVWPDRLQVELHHSSLPRLAALEPVRMIYERLPVFLHGEETTTTMQTGSYNGGAVPYHSAGIDGGGGDTDIAQVLMVLDSGIQLDAGDLSDTRTSAGTPGPSHRKVRLYRTTNEFGGLGNLRGCDASINGGFTHGHLVAATALGNATDVPVGYGPGWQAIDVTGDSWKLDGVAPGAVLVAYDGQVTPLATACDDPQLDGLHPGVLYSSQLSGGSLGEAYSSYDARIINFSWGTTSNVYDPDAQDIDRFLRDHADALVFVSVGNQGGSDYGIPVESTMGDPATCKNCLSIGASRNSDLAGAPASRELFSGMGPAVYTEDPTAAPNRIAPQLMAPGGESGSGALGLASEFACATGDNDQDDPVECDVVVGLEGTSYSSAAAAGTALLVRDYFAQGFYPAGEANTAARVPTISGALIKALLVASADFMTGDNLTRNYRWNNEQGYGRIQLDNVLPLENWPPSPSGLIVHDPGSPVTGGGVLSDLTLVDGLNTGQESDAEFQVCNDTEELRIALAWSDYYDVSNAPHLVNDLNLTVVSPSGKQYRGNYFTDDNDLSGTLEGVTEDCPGIGDLLANELIDEGPWSLPICNNSGVQGRGYIVNDFDDANVTEAVFLSPDPDGNANLLDGTCTSGSGANANDPCGNDLDCALDPRNVQPNDECDGGTQQVEVGTWSITVRAQGTIADDPQTFAVAIAGGVCLGSSVRLDRAAYTCNESVRVHVNELHQTGDPDDQCVEATSCSLTTTSSCTSDADCPGGITADVVAGRVTIRVFDGTTEVDCEGPGCADPSTGLTFVQPDANALLFESDPVVTTRGTVPKSGNGVLDVQHGNVVEVTYADVLATRKSRATLNCQASIGFGDVTIRRFGQDASFEVQGGCERARPRQDETDGFFEYGYPDRYMDADELIEYAVAFHSNEPEDLHDVVAVLSCVKVDTDSPLGCLPNGAGCEPAECGGDCDPRRENNEACSSWMTVLDSPKRIGLLPATAATSASFSIQVKNDDAFEGTTPAVEMILEITSDTSGHSVSSLIVSRHRLNVDETEALYSTDFPTGGLDIVLDLDNNESEDNPITDLESGVRGLDYRFETRTYSDMTENGGNLGLLSPWNFDLNDGGFRTGLAAATDFAEADSFNIHNWGEDRNFNGIEDGFCLSDHSIACYNFGSGTDPRCSSGAHSCVSTENSAGDASFVQNRNTKGGCGWQTKAPNYCSLDTSRGCDAANGNEDCYGYCLNVNNGIVSTLDPCSITYGVACPDVHQCNSLLSPPSGRCGSCNGDESKPCLGDDDCGIGVDCVPDDDLCGGVADACITVSQTCVDEAGSCTGVGGRGGIWHTGEIGDSNQTCDGASGSACADYKVISSTGGTYIWWELLVTPVMEKVDRTVGSDGLPNSRIEIVDWAWNQSINLADHNVFVTWEFDTDASRRGGVDLFGDAHVLGFRSGPFGAVAGDPAGVHAYELFAPMARCDTTGPPCTTDSDCGEGVDCVWLSASVNGVLGNNRVGQNACFFEDSPGIPPEFQDALRLAGPPDNDLDDDSDDVIDEYVTPAGPIRNAGITQTLDMRDDVLEDLYGETGDTFQAAIGFVNFEGTPDFPAEQSYGLGIDDMVVEWRELSLGLDTTNCAGGSCATVEVTTASRFEGAATIGITVLDVSPYGRACDGAGDADHGEVCYGNADCLSENCSPVFNDCDLDGNFRGTGDDADCNNNNIDDVVVLAYSDAEPEGEPVVLDQSSHPGLYAGELTISVHYDTDGVLFLVPTAEEDAVAFVRYDDLNDGTGVACPNDADPDNRGRMEAATTVFVSSCEVSLTRLTISDNGDGDSFADTDETVHLGFSVVNKCGVPLTNCVARLATESEWIDCIKTPAVALGDLADTGAPVPSPEAFVFKVSDLVNRTDPDDDFSAAFVTTIACDEIDAVWGPLGFSLDLDLTLTDFAQQTLRWSEGFEIGPMLTDSKFAAENLDAGIPGYTNAEGLVNGDGWRCQYNDPEWPNSNTYDTAYADDCYPGMNMLHANAVYWQVDGSDAWINSPDGGRAFLGNGSMYYGIFLTGPADGFTTPMASVESVKTVDPINLGVDTPQLSFWHQISLVDYRTVSADYLHSVDRGVVQIQLVDDPPPSYWRNLVPFQNGYDEVAADNYFNCMFDPIDDGNTEDDFFDPTDPDREYGPSSTCFAEPTFGCLGDTDEPFEENNVCHATTSPETGDAPELGIGTWVQTKVDLSEYRGRRVRIRFLVSSFKAFSETWEQLFPSDLGPGDDGWWIDEIVIDETLEIPAELQADKYVLRSCATNGRGCIGVCEVTLGTDCTTDAGCPNQERCVNPCDAVVEGACTGLPPECGDDCSEVQANLFVEPHELLNPVSVTTPAPGQLVQFNADSSWADACFGGTLQYRFCVDGAGDADCADAEDPILRRWTEDPVLRVAPDVSTSYTVEVRCSSAIDCFGGVNVDIDVDCPPQTNCDCTTDADCDDDVACTDDSCDSVFGCQNLDNCPFGETCNPESGLCDGGGILVTFQENLAGYAGTGDTFIQEATPSAVNGALESIEWDFSDGTPAGMNLMLVRFDEIFGVGPGQVPPGATIVSATLEYTVGGSGDPTGEPATVHEVRVAWDESVSFDNFGGDSGATAGDEYEVASIDDALGDTLGPQLIDVTGSLQAWSADPGSNQGWIFVPQGPTGNGVEVRSSEYSRPGLPRRPKLSVSYTPPALNAGDVIIAGFQANGSPEFVELFNTTDQAISLENTELISRVDADPGDGTVDIDWELSADLTGATIEPYSFFLISEAGVTPGPPDLQTTLNLATGEGGTAERAIGLELLIDSTHMDYVLYGRHDGSTPANEIPPGDVTFDGVSYPRDEVIRTVTGSLPIPSFPEGVTQRWTANELHAGYEALGFYTDEDSLPDGNPNGVWTSLHSTTGSYTARNSLSPQILPPFCDDDADCDDDLYCNGEESCDVGGTYTCLSGTPVDCDDAVGCTLDSCNETTDQCDHAADDNACDDSNLCTDDTCNVVAGCQYTNNTAPCNDGNACTLADTCGGGACMGGPPDDCDDDVACTDDSCDSVLGCQYADNCPSDQTCNLVSGLCEGGGTLVTFQEDLAGYAGTGDTFIQEATPSAVNGALESIEWDFSDGSPAGMNLMLVRFDEIFGVEPGQVPSGADIVSAMLEYSVGGDGDPTGLPATVHELLVAWDETVSFGSLGGDPGASAGDEYDAASIGLANGDTLGPQLVDVTESLQAWSTDPGSNQGWIFVPVDDGTNGVEVRSSEYQAGPFERPKLSVRYTPHELSAGDVIIAGFQASTSSEWVELFNTTQQAIPLDGMNLTAWMDLDPVDGVEDIDWDFVFDESPDLTGATIAARSFFLIGEPSVTPAPDLVSNLDLSTTEMGPTERALSLELVIDGVHMDYLLYGRHDGADSVYVPPGDIVFDGFGPTTLVPAGATWLYLDDGSDQGAAWRQPGYDDGGWVSGPAQLGYGDGDEATVVDCGCDPCSTCSPKNVTTYFRHVFNVPSAASVTGLTLTLVRDDGAVVYVNGIEVRRDNISADPVLFDTLADSPPVAGADESTFFPSNEGPAVLVDGLNVLAVEIHQQSLTSSDISFDLELVADVTVRAEVIRTVAGTLFSEGVTQRLNLADLLAGHAMEGFYTDEDSLPGSFPPGIWASTHASTGGAAPRNAASTDSDGDGIVDVVDDCVDVDGDGWGNGNLGNAGCAIDWTDCDDGDADTYPGAVEVNDGKDNQCPGDPGYGLVDEISGASGFLIPDDNSKFCWEAQTGATGYEVARAEDSTFAGCSAVATDENCYVDPFPPGIGGAYFYLVRVAAPLVGSWGEGINEAERALPCP